jgi:lysophospholipase L1-like esterase
LRKSEQVKNVDRLVAFSAFLLVAACGLAARAADVPASAPPKADPDATRFTAEIAAFEAWDRKNSSPKDAILFVGSSSIRMWQTAESFPNLPVINRGFGGAQTSDVNHYADRIVVKYDPKTVVFYSGDNDMAAGKSPEQVMEDIAEFFESIHEELPEAQVIYLPVKPSLARWKLWPEMQETNALVKQYVDGRDYITYVDTATPMLGSDGQPRQDIFLNDGLHMNERGYQLWVDALRGQLAE